MQDLIVVNPVAVLTSPEARSSPQFPRAARPATLDGSRVGLFWNGKTHGRHALDRVRDLISKSFSDVVFNDYLGDKGGLTRFASPEMQKRIVAECDVIVGTTGDCGSCTSWLIRDMTQLEHHGLPTVCFVSTGFVDDARVSAEVFGCAELTLAEVPLPFTNRDEASIHSMVDEVFDDVVSALTSDAPIGNRPTRHVEVEQPNTDSERRFAGSDLLEAFDQFNRVAISERWSDGLPLIAPTRSKVDAMIKISGRSGDEVVGTFAPAMGAGTIECVAANAVMAGLEPEAFPVLLAAVDCILDPTMGLRTWAMSTGPQAPIVMVSGPVTEAIGMNSGVCALGPGAISAVNVAIGRALHLVVQNIGHAFPGVGDLDTIGTPLKFSACVAENEARNPWPAYRLAHGFSADQSAVTVNVPYGMVELFDFDSNTAEGLIASYASVTTSVAASPHPGNWLIKTNGDPTSGYPFNGMSQNLILLCPEHAATFAGDGWSIHDVRQALHRASRLPFHQAMVNKSLGLFIAAHPELSPYLDDPNQPVSLYKSADSFDIFVVGADAGRSLYFPGGTHSVTKVVR